MIEQIEHFLAGKEKRICFGNRDQDSKFLFPGSFNPLHIGHQKMANYAVLKYGAPVDFEISVLNVDKPTLNSQTLHERLGQFDKLQNVWLTKAATFAEKAALFPGVTFLLGADTVRRILQRKYYQREGEFRSAIDQFAENQCQFLAFGRLLDGTFTSKEMFSIPDKLGDLMEFVPEREFRCDTSSTEIRRGRDANS